MMVTWDAFSTIWWFASGEQIMMYSVNKDLLTEMYNWYLGLWEE
jgi:hypothetical protein